LQRIFKFLFQIFLILSLLTVQVIADEIGEVKLSNIYKNIRCLVCQGQSIEDSNSDFAVNLRMLIKDKIDDGLDEEDVYKFLKEKYGDWILFKPSFELKNIFLWLFPYAAFILVGFYLFFLAKKNRIQ
tara:strand:+ start:140 stop:523 length:384 start_codon:yes stop_codon:yes gene_type:complete